MSDTPKSSPFGIAKAVFWSFLGIRKGKDHGADVTRLTLPQVVVGGLIGAALFIGTLITVVYFVTH